MLFPKSTRVSTVDFRSKGTEGAPSHTDILIQGRLSYTRPHKTWWLNNYWNFLVRTEEDGHKRKKIIVYPSVLPSHSPPVSRIWISISDTQLLPSSCSILPVSCTPRRYRGDLTRMIIHSPFIWSRTYSVITQWTQIKCRKRWI